MLKGSHADRLVLYVWAGSKHAHTEGVFITLLPLAFVYLDDSSHPLDLFEIFNIWTSGC